ncbi:polypeptide N-acetylgalactosaminyltransferase 5 [Culex pipiens pallens]|uniref:polypeptide N-acetylgalactosaminyltransferase 5 n=1 Tax=Culex pipiens pallens TaxID=42434 RepID=UPI0022AA11C6|nr:polypeptide N-acetylgalactosaminyltransferase 5 [Culex pipiens pallens]XP_052563711.1 polypeptide N-acetylgalactosaminyltransferase 5 [Culex pipiens pallens]XP_052563712.1 polypeptide N-acetylgalactosaminyltransferase 5 [Culex pipiens pallens]XP_052563713.1 polypeptide N-acetylgalactosaminyltransferase 5 [Culex pipiens pallens]
MTNINYSRMFRGKIRTNTCRIVLLTSLVWLLIDVILIMNYADCLGGSSWLCKRPGEYDVEVSHPNMLTFWGDFVL